MKWITGTGSLGDWRGLNKWREDVCLPAFLGQQPLPVLTVGGTAGHGAKQVRVDLDHLVHLRGVWIEIKKRAHSSPCSVLTLERPKGEELTDSEPGPHTLTNVTAGRGPGVHGHDDSVLELEGQCGRAMGHLYLNVPFLVITKRPQEFSGLGEKGQRRGR